jgi:ribosomal protein L11 methylase PrmA
MIDNLKNCIKSLKQKKQITEWSTYYQNTNYSAVGIEQKKTFIEQTIKYINPSTVLDLGANTGFFSKLVANDIFTISTDIDPNAVNYNYLTNRQPLLLPLIIDITNPSPDIGWRNVERNSFLSRLPKNLTVIAVALIHHLVITYNVPLAKIAYMLNKISNNLIIEFIPKHDSQVMKLLSTRKDDFLNYTEEDFERIFSNYLKLRDKVKIFDSERKIYFFEKVR